MPISRPPALTDGQRAAVLTLARSIERRTGAPPLSDQALAQLGAAAQPGPDAVRHFLLLDGDELTGYAQLAAGTLEVVGEPAVLDELLAAAEGGVLIQDVSGVHSGANPISGEFSVGATGLRIRDGALGEPLREMTIASTIPEMLSSVSAVGSDLRFFTSVGTPSILIGEMTVAGV